MVIDVPGKKAPPEGDGAAGCWNFYRLLSWFRPAEKLERVLHPANSSNVFDSFFTGADIECLRPVMHVKAKQKNLSRFVKLNKTYLFGLHQSG